MFQTPKFHLGSPTQVGPLTVFPVWTDAPQPTRPLRARLPKGATIGEHDDGATVEHLLVDNPTAKAFLLPAGTVFAGGQQDRTLLATVVVGPQSRLRLDVRCVEAGRWGGGRRQQIRARRAPLAVRGALCGIDRHDGHPHGSQHGGAPIGGALYDDGRFDGGLPVRRGDQGEVWRRVATYQELGASATGSLLPALEEPRTTDLVTELGRLAPLPGQRGVLIGIAGHPALLEVFDHPTLLADQWEPILTSVAADAARVPVTATTGARARTFAAHVSNRRLARCGRAGVAHAAEARDQLAVIDAVVDDHRADHGDNPSGPIHLTALNARHHLVRG
jgi:hypothetical protein